MMRGERILPLSDTHEHVLVTLTTGILPDPGGLQDQEAGFVDDLHRTRAEISRQAAQRQRERRFELGR
jgi:hypothetical protein